jgi:hypothetical protein
MMIAANPATIVQRAVFRLMSAPLSGKRVPLAFG